MNGKTSMCLMGLPEGAKSKRKNAKNLQKWKG